MAAKHSPPPDPAAPRPRRLSRWTFWSFRLQVVVLIGLLVLVFVAERTLVTVEAGYAAVVFRSFGGTQRDVVRGEGLHFIPPWDQLILYDIRLQRREWTLNAKAADGVPLRLRVSVRFRPHAARLPALHQEVGPDYVEAYLQPEVDALLRERVSRVPAAALVSAERSAPDGSLLQDAAELDTRFVQLDDVIVVAIER